MLPPVLEHQVDNEMETPAIEGCSISMFFWSIYGTIARKRIMGPPWRISASVLRWEMGSVIQALLRLSFGECSEQNIP